MLEDLAISLSDLFDVITSTGLGRGLGHFSAGAFFGLLNNKFLEKSYTKEQYLSQYWSCKLAIPLTVIGFAEVIEFAQNSHNILRWASQADVFVTLAGASLTALGGEVTHYLEQGYELIKPFGKTIANKTANIREYSESVASKTYSFLFL